MHLNSVDFLPLKETVHLINGDLKNWDPRYHQDVPRVNLVDLYSLNTEHYVQFLCVCETKPVLDPRTNTVKLRIFDRTASLAITIYDITDDTRNKQHLLDMEPGEVRQIASHSIPLPDFSNSGILAAQASATPVVPKVPSNSITVCLYLARPARATIWRV